MSLDFRKLFACLEVIFVNDRSFLFGSFLNCHTAKTDNECNIFYFVGTCSHKMDGNRIHHRLHI